MAESSIPVNLLNPGQVFASIGLLEAADLLSGNATGGFSWGCDSASTFRVRTSGAEPPVECVMAFLDDAEVVPLAPAHSPNIGGWKGTWGTEPEILDVGNPFPFPDPQSPATLPVVLRDRKGREIPLDYWGDATRRDNVKFWAGAAGLPGAAILRNALRIVSGKTRQHAGNPFDLSDVQSNSFRFDWRRDYVPIQVGFSPNRHRRIQMLGFPLVEILAAIGMSHARPNRVAKLQYEYGVLGGGESGLIDPLFHRAALGAGENPVPGRPFRRFVMQLDWPGQEDQARCISQVAEKEIDQ